MQIIRFDLFLLDFENINKNRRNTCRFLKRESQNHQINRFVTIRERIFREQNQMLAQIGPRKSRPGLQLVGLVTIEEQL
jgi:hypothetical protein